MDLSDADWARLERHVTRRGTPDELAELDRWVEGSADLGALAHGMRTAGLEPEGQAPAWDEDEAWHRVSRRMRWFASRPLGSDVRWRRTSWAAAAAVVLAAGIVLVLGLGHRAGREVEATRAAPVREMVTRRGERAVFKLPDGTRVTLGAASRLRISPSYDGTGAGRDVYLDGQGYFEVTHDSLHPFRVATPLGTAEDLGTQFVVTTYPETRGMRVVVASGVVALRRPPGGGRSKADSLPLLTLATGDLARLDSAGTATVTRVDPGSYLAWTHGTLVFRSTPLRDVVPQLARWYDLDIRLADRELENRRLTATFDKHSIAQVLNLIALSLDLTVERAGDVILLHPAPPS